MNRKIFSVAVIFSVFLGSQGFADCDAANNLLPELTQGVSINPAYTTTGSVFPQAGGKVSLFSSGSSLSTSVPGLQAGATYNGAVTANGASNSDYFLRYQQGPFSRDISLTDTQATYQFSYHVSDPSAPARWTAGKSSGGFGFIDFYQPCLSFGSGPAPRPVEGRPAYSSQGLVVTLASELFVNAFSKGVLRGSWPVENRSGGSFSLPVRKRFLSAEIGASWSFANLADGLNKSASAGYWRCGFKNVDKRFLDLDDFLNEDGLVAGNIPVETSIELSSNSSLKSLDKSFLTQQKLLAQDVPGYYSFTESNSSQEDALIAIDFNGYGFSRDGSFDGTASGYLSLETSQGQEIFSTLETKWSPESDVWGGRFSDTAASFGVFYRRGGENSIDRKALEASLNRNQSQYGLAGAQNNFLAQMSLTSAENSWADLNAYKSVTIDPTVENLNIFKGLVNTAARAQTSNENAAISAKWLQGRYADVAEGQGCHLGANALDLSQEDLIALNDSLDESVVAGLSLENFKVQKKENKESYFQSCTPLKYQYQMASRNYGMAALKFEKAAEICAEIKEKAEFLVEIIKMVRKNHPFRVSQNEEMNEDQLVAANSLDASQMAQGQESKEDANAKVHVWTRGVGQYIDSSKSHNNPASKVGSGGAMAGADWKIQDFTIGFSGGYIYSYAGIKHGEGHTNLNQGMLSVYSGWQSKDFALNYSLMSGYTASNNHRYFKSGTTKQSTEANTHIWQFGPHFDITYQGAFKDSWFNVEPFASGDWMGSWSSKYKEKGSSDSNISQDGFFSSFLRVESGLRFKERIAIRYGYLWLTESASYGYQRMFNPSQSVLSIVGAAESFSVANSSSIQSLGIAGFAMKFEPKNKSLPVVEVGYQGQFGSVYLAQIGSINISKDF